MESITSWHVKGKKVDVQNDSVGDGATNHWVEVFLERIIIMNLHWQVVGSSIKTMGNK